MSAEREPPENVPTLRLTDEGLETPADLVGRTGQVRMEKPDITMTFTIGGDGLGEVNDLTSFPPADPDDPGGRVPEGHIRLAGTLYEVVDDRDLSDCPHCGSDKVSATGDPPKCYSCETELEGIDR